jgi:hypothetical protein
MKSITRILVAVALAVVCIRYFGAIGDAPAVAQAPTVSLDRSGGAAGSQVLAARDRVIQDSQASYQVLVVDKETRSPIGGTRLLVNGAIQVETDADGAASVMHDGPITIRFAASGYGAGEIKAALGTEVLTIELTRVYEVAVVTLDTDSRPVHGVPIQVNSPFTTFAAVTDELGRAAFPGLVDGTYRLAIPSGDWFPVAMEIQGNHQQTQQAEFIRVPRDQAVRITVARARVGCALIVGDDVVAHHFQSRYVGLISSPGFLGRMFELGSHVKEKFPGVFATACLPRMNVTSVLLSAYLEHSGWATFEVPLQDAGPEIRPSQFHVASGSQLATAFVSRADSLDVPLRMHLQDTTHGMFEFELGRGDPVEVPWGEYRFELSSNARLLAPWVTIVPGVATAGASSGKITVTASASASFARRTITFHIATGVGIRPADGYITVHIQEKRVDRLTVQKDMTVDLWLPKNELIEWRHFFFDDGERVECIGQSFVAETDPNSAKTEITLRPKGR